MNKLLVATLICWLSISVQAMPGPSAPIALTTDLQCSENNQQHGISTGDVTGNMGGSTDCWGAMGAGNTGNDPGPSGGGFSIGGEIYDFIAKEDYGSGTVGNIGLVVSPQAESGTWEFTPGALEGNDFLIVLKQSNDPGYAVWLFAEGDAASYSGTWFVAWSAGLSHFSIYKGQTSKDRQVPVPATLWLMGAGLAGLGLGKRKR